MRIPAVVVCLLFCAPILAVEDGEGLIAHFGPQSEFFFGVANAPAQVEDQLDDAWLEFAAAGRTAGFTGYPDAAERMRFWTNPEVDIKLAALTGARVFRLGVDWGLTYTDTDISSSDCGDDDLCDSTFVLSASKSF